MTGSARILAKPGWRMLAFFMAAGLAAFEGPAQRQDSPPDLASMNLEELMKIEVTSVAKKEQKLSAAPAAIYVITQEDIRRSGLTSIPEVLRMVPGLEVARIGAHDWSITARGFNGHYGNKLLVLMDGRSVYTPLFSGVYWDTQDVMLEDIDRIEVIRGPGATMWGANAVNGVINIITKPAKETQGGLLVTGGGNEELGTGAARYGAALGPKAYYRAYSRYWAQRESLSPGSRDDGNLLQGGFRIDWDQSDRNSWTFEGSAYRGRMGLNNVETSLTPPFLARFAAPAEPHGGNVLARWKHRTSDRSDTDLLFYFDTFSREGEPLGEHRHTFNIDFDHRIELSPRQEILWGLGSRISSDGTATNFFASTLPRARTEPLYSAFLQDELRLVPHRLIVTAGVKLEHNVYTGFEVQPDARLMWTPTKRQAAWAAVSRAVRTPSRVDQTVFAHVAVFPDPVQGLDLVTLSGNRQLRSETVLAYQAGYRLQPGHKLSFDVAGFYNSYDRLEAIEPDPPYVISGPVPYRIFPTHLDNKRYGDGRGLEISAAYQPADAWRLSLGYTWLDLDLHLYKSSGATSAGTPDGDDPHYQVQARSYLDLPRHLQWDAALYYVSAIHNQNMAGYTRLDTRLGWRPVRDIEFSIGGQNLLDNRHPEFFLPNQGVLQQSEIGRSVYGKIAWRF